MIIKAVEKNAFPDHLLKSVHRQHNRQCYEVKVDAQDEKLMQLLGQDASHSSDILARQLKLSAATVRRRRRRLLRSGVMRIIAVTDPNKIGYPIAAVVAFKVTLGKLESFMKILASQPKVIWSSINTGRFDIITIMRFRSFDELYDFLRSEMANVEGLRNIEAFFCLDVDKGRYQPLYVGSRKGLAGDSAIVSDNGGNQIPLAEKVIASHLD